MGTYHNAYDILSDMREGLNEHSTALVQGTATHGIYSNTYLMKKMNRAVRLIYARLLKLNPDHFETDGAVTVTSGVITLPWDFGVIRRLEDENDLKVFPSDVDKRPAYGGRGSDRRYRRHGNTLVLLDTSYSGTYHLWYWRKPRELDMGQAAAENTLASSAKMLADYYNGMGLEDITGAQVGTISDYTAARVITADITLADDAYYGIVSDLPEMFHALIAPLGIIIAKAEHPTSPEKPTKAEIEIFRSEFDDAAAAFGMPQGDVGIEDIFCDFGGPAIGGVNIPGQGYTIF